MKNLSQNDCMKIAITLANKAKKHGEVPIGAVVEKDGRILGKGFNRREKTKNALSHAEIIAINKACKKTKSWRLDGCNLYVTLEPCPMCAGAIANARIDNLFFACKERTSQDNLCPQILSSNRLNHKVQIVQLKEFEGAASQLLTDFFKEKRNNKK